MADSKRKSYNIRKRREELREELKSREYLRQIHALLEKDWEDKAPEMKGKMDGYFRLLAKTLPDVKSIELTGNEGGDIVTNLKVTFVDTDSEGV